MNEKRRHVAKADVPPTLGRAIQRLRKAYHMSLGDLSEVSGVAKSIISQIERNETNPTIGTVMKLSRALDTPLRDVLGEPAEGPAIVQHQKRPDIPILRSEDGLCELAIIGALELVEHVQWYDFHARPGGELVSEAHQAGCMEHLHVLKGTLCVRSGQEEATVRAGETLRYRGDLDHVIRNCGKTDAHATMVLIMRPLGESAP